MTMNESWGYNASDAEYKTARQLIHTLCEVAGRGGNLLLNVSPTGEGRLAPEQTDRLDEIAKWMATNGESIIGTSPGLQPWQFYGPSTRREQATYLHLLMRPYETVTVRGVPIKRVKAVRALSTREALHFTTRCSIIDVAVNPNPKGELTVEVQERSIDPYATVVAVEIEDG